MVFAFNFDVKEKILSLLRATERPDIEFLIDYMENDTDYFDAPASSTRHSNFRGGLAVHSLVVYYMLVRLNEIIPLFKPDELVIIPILHDLCKTNMYELNINKDLSIHKTIPYKVHDHFPIGHGEKSVILAQKHFKLYQNEAMCIRYHMWAYEKGFTDPITPFSKISKEDIVKQNCPQAYLMHVADMLATNYIENGIVPIGEKDE